MAVRWGIPFALLALGVIAALTPSKPNNSATWRYRQTLTLERAETEYSVASVIEVTNTVSEAVGSRFIAFDWRGEAPSVDIPSVGRIYVLVRERPNQQTISYVGDACGIAQPSNLAASAAIMAQWLHTLDREFPVDATFLYRRCHISRS